MTMISNQHAALCRSRFSVACRYVEWLDETGQVDLDDNMEPIISGFEPGDDGVRIYFLRDRTYHNTMIPKRARWPAEGEPKFRTTLDPSDGWKRQEKELKTLAPDPTDASAGAERARRVAEGDYEALAARLAHV